MRTIVSSEHIKINDKVDIFEWSDSDGGFGVLEVKYLDNGHYDFDSEYMSLDTIIQILKLANDKQT